MLLQPTTLRIQKDDKSNGSPGMIGLETSFAICNTFLVRKKHIDYKVKAKS